jgi:hypothetical protein
MHMPSYCKAPRGLSKNREASLYKHLSDEIILSRGFALGTKIEAKGKSSDEVLAALLSLKKDPVLG